MSLYNGPVRPGARGGRGEFNWENVKAGDSKDREYYLGHSVKALAGRWQKNKDVYWYTRDKGGGSTLEDEVKAVKQREEEVMMEALGLKPKTVSVVHQPMDQKELAAILKKNAPEEEEGADKAKGEAMGIKGLGFAAGAGLPRAASGAQGMESGGTLEGEGFPLPPAAGPSSQLPRPAAQLPGPPTLPGPPPLSSAAGGTLLLGMLASGAKLSSQQIKELAKHDKKAGKLAKKAAKRAKKEAKRAKKERSRSAEPGHAAATKKRARHDTDSGSGSSSEEEGQRHQRDQPRHQPDQQQRQQRQRPRHDSPEDVRQPARQHQARQPSPPPPPARLTGSVPAARQPPALPAA